MKNKFKFTERDRIDLNFIHIRTKESTVFTFENNPMTGKWLFTQNGGSCPQMLDKRGVSSLIANVFKKNQKDNLPCEVKITPSIHWKTK